MKLVYKTLKRILSLTLALFFLLTLFPLSVFASEAVANGTFGDALVWTLDAEGTLTISGAGAMPDYTYTSHAPWYNSRNTIKGVVIDNGVENIGNFAFIGCSRLESVIIGDHVTCIGDRAFDGCISLDSISIPENVAKIGIMAFVGCKSLSIVYFEGDAPVFEVTKLDGSGLYASWCFQDVTATMYYPAGNITWTDEIMQDYSGNITWHPYEMETGSTSELSNGVKLYIPVVESRLDKYKHDDLTVEDQQKCRGLLYDLNGDNTVELILRLKDEYSFYYEVWSITNEKAVCVNEPFFWGFEPRILLSHFEGSKALVYQDWGAGSVAASKITTVYTFEEIPYKESYTLHHENIFDIDTPDEIGDYYYINGAEVSEKEYSEQLSIVTDGIELFVAETQYEGLNLSELLDYLQNSKTESDQYADVEIPSPIMSMVSFNNFFVGNYYDNLNQMYQYDSVAQGILDDSSIFQINWNSCLSALSNKEFLDVLKLENHPEYYYQTVLLESIMQTKLDDDYWSALMSQVSQISLDAVSYYVKYDANFTSYDKILKQKLNATMTDFSIDSVQYKRLSDYYGQYCKQLKTYDTVKDIYDLTVKTDGTVEDFFNALSNYASVYGTAEEIISALEYLKVHLEGSDNKEDQYILTAVNNILASLSRTLDEQLVLNCLGTAKDLLWGVFWAAISDAFPNVLALDIASFTIDSGLTLSNVFFPTTISADSYCKLYANYAIEVVTREALNKAYTTYSANPTDELATITVGLYDLLGYTYVHEIEVATVLSEQLHKDGLLNGLRNLFSEKNMTAYEYEQECIKAYGAYLNDVKAVKVEAQTAYGLTTGSIQPVIIVYMVNGKVVTTTESTVATGDVYSLPSGEIDLPDFMGLYLEIGGYYTDEKLTNPYEESCVTKPLSLYCNVLLRRTSDQVPVLVDHSTGISVSRGESMENYVLCAELVESGNVYESAKKFFNGAELDLYDISLSINGSTVQPDGSVLVQIPIDDEHAKMEGTVYYVVSDGKYSNVNATYENKSYYFRTTHFSNYLIVYESKETNWYIPLFVIVAICVMGVVMLSKKKKNRK